MFFKNILFYQLTKPFNLTGSELEAQLQKFAFLPCPISEPFSMGWCNPFETESDLLVHAIQGKYIFALCREEKILPASVIRDEFKKQIALIKKQEGRDLTSSEKTRLKEDIIYKLRQQAFHRKKIIHAYIDTQQQFLIINTSNRKKAEELCSLLRKTLGSLALALPETQVQPYSRMTQWLVDKQEPPKFSVHNDCDLIDLQQRNTKIKCRQHDLSAEEIIRHLNSGKVVTNLSMSWYDKIAFELGEDLTFRKVRFINLSQENSKQDSSLTREEILDANFALMTGEFSLFMQDTLSLFDGLKSIDSPVN